MYCAICFLEALGPLGAALNSKSLAHSARASGEQKSGYTEGPGQQNPWKSSPAEWKSMVYDG